MPATIYEINKRYYDTPGVAETYGKRTSLQKGEEVILSLLAEKIRNKPLLEIGVGQGRTTPYLSALTEQYVGIDYSENMLKPCKLRHPTSNLLLCDGRSLSFSDESFEAVYFCWNAIDDAGHDDRTLMLREVYRVLRGDGVFFFSSHNIDAKRRSPYHFRGFAFDARLKLLNENLRRVNRYARAIRNHLRMARHERHEQEYSIVNDHAEDFSLLTYYISKENQVRQLERAGFCDVRMVGLEGSFVKRGEPCYDPWIFYIARKELLK
jgi:ubiquinone/menaquinone biosynthesis C-methylase UbiE